MPFSEIFYWFLNMSITGTIVGIAVLLIGKISKIPQKAVALLWFFPFLRMWLPVSVSSKYSLASLIIKFWGRAVSLNNGNSVFSTTNHIMGAENYFPTTYKNALLEKVFGVAAIIWVTLASVFMIVIIISYFKTKKEIKNAHPFKNNIFFSAEYDTPFVCGIVHPKIILPFSLQENGTDKTLKYILMHEKAHIKRWDNLWRIVAIITACMHWFNPFAWLFLKAFLRSLELSCDEKVIKNLSLSECKEYASILLDYTKNNNMFVSTFGGAKIRLRVEKILSYKRLSTFGIIALSFFVCAIAYALLTNSY